MHEKAVLVKTILSLVLIAGGLFVALGTGCSVDLPDANLWELGKQAVVAMAVAWFGWELLKW